MKNPPESLILKLHTFSNDVYFNLRNPPKWIIMLYLYYGFLGVKLVTIVIIL